MTKKRMVLEIGMGTDIRGADPTKAACRALRDALWHNSLSIAPALGHPLDAMIVDVHIGVPRPEMVDKAQVLAVLPYGKGSVSVVEGGLEIHNDSGHRQHVDCQRLRRRQSRHRLKEASMPKTRVILELGSGNDLHGSDYTKAALRAVQDALHHSSLSFVRSLKIDKTKLDVEVTIGVQRPEQVDLDKVKNSLPVGNVTVKAIKGGLDVADPENNDPAVIASAAIAVRIEVA